MKICRLGSLKYSKYFLRPSGSVQRSCSGSVPPQYNPAEVEAKWQRYWKELSLEKEVDNTLKNDQKKFYALSMFPYPSGRLHMGHVRVYTITDCIARYQRLKGLKVLHPMGWDAFGLPAENAAIERGIHPAQWTKDNISHMRGQLESLGFDFDWKREVLTCSPEYYRWTQWLFLQLYKHGLAYRKKAWVNWDPVDQTVLANEQVDNNGCSWRSGAKVEQRQMEQWFLKLSSYAESLLQGLDALNWPTSVKQLQSEYIGKSEGVYFEFKLQGLSLPPLKVFTTKPEVVFGATFVAISPDHELLKSSELFEDTVLQEIGKCFHDKRNFDQVEGMDLGLKAINPFTGEAVPVYVANFVLSNYGTGAIMGVPGHSQKDEAFALRHSLPVKQVIDKENSLLVNSGQFSGMSVGDASKAILQEAVAGGFGGTGTQYKLSDWLISRQRYWGAPIPILYCDKCGIVPVEESSLPVVLPVDVALKGKGLSPLAGIQEWQQASCGKPNCCARREVDTMDTFVDSSWYFLRYICPQNSNKPFTDDVKEWMPVDIYVGGMEHAVLHLLYARFISHFLHDIGLVKEKEPFKQLITQGIVFGKTYKLLDSGRYLTPEEQRCVENGNSFEGEEVVEGWEKMSKSKHNGVEPKDLVRQYGADTVRIYTLFKCPPESDILWDSQAIKGSAKFLSRLWNLCYEHIEKVCSRRETQQAGTEEGAEGGGGGKEEELKLLLQETKSSVSKVMYAMERSHHLNVAVSNLMVLLKSLYKLRSLSSTPAYHQSLRTLCLLLSPMAPHIASQLLKDLKKASAALRVPETVELPEVESKRRR